MGPGQAPLYSHSFGHFGHDIQIWPAFVQGLYHLLLQLEIVVRSDPSGLSHVSMFEEAATRENNVGILGAGGHKHFSDGYELQPGDKLPSDPIEIWVLIHEIVSGYPECPNGEGLISEHGVIEP